MLASYAFAVYKKEFLKLLLFLESPACITNADQNLVKTAGFRLLLEHDLSFYF